ncbi:MAG: DUF3791 domain-containing protein [Bacteroidaceae bacterium]|nr:DUF3791 domain-containing protein [Bacteroidaceae bacterium]
MDKYKIPYLHLCVRKFAERFRMSDRTAFRYLRHFGGMTFLLECYDIEHTLPINDTIDALREICRKEGGTL